MKFTTAIPATNVRQQLAMHPLFSRLSEDQLNKVMEKARVSEVDAGVDLVRQGDPAKCFFLVLSGRVKLYRLSPSGDEKVIEVITPGSVFAEALMFSDAPFYPVSAQALDSAKALRIDNANFKALLGESVDLCFLMLGDMSRRLHGLLREIDDLSLHTAIGRLAGHLMLNAPDNNESFELSMPKQILASRLSIKPETFSRILKQLGKQKLIEVKDSRIRILDREAMLEIADTCALQGDSLFESFPKPAR